MLNQSLVRNYSSPFGKFIPNNSLCNFSYVSTCTEEYRFSFNGKEHDDETSTQDYGMRIYNAALGKFLSVDPLTRNYPELTPYQFAGDRPIDCVDMDGTEPQSVNDGSIFKSGPPVKPYIGHDSRMEWGSAQPTEQDRKDYFNWMQNAVGSSLLRPWMSDANAAYMHYMYNTGSDYQFNLGRYFTEDPAGGKMLESCIWLAKDGAERLLQSAGSIQMYTGQLISGDIGSSEEKRWFPYPETENWQKAIGGFSFWMSADVTSTVNNGIITYTMTLNIYAEDLYNFDPGKIDIATGIPDNVNARFQQVGFAKEFMQYGSYSTTIIWSDQQVENPAPAPAPPPSKPTDQLNQPGDM